VKFGGERGNLAYGPKFIAYLTKIKTNPWAGGELCFDEDRRFAGFDR
jgi:hypothetical protein